MNNLSRVKNRQIRPMPTRAKDRGFTLIEVLVVTGVIGILLGIAVPAYNEYREKGKIAEARYDLKRIETAIVTLATDTGEWPNHQTIGYKCEAPVNCNTNELSNFYGNTAGLLIQDPGTAYDNWNGPYIPSIPKDPWGNDYFMDTDYTIDGNSNNVVIGSFGPDECCENSYDADNVLLRLPCKTADCKKP